MAAFAAPAAGQRDLAGSVRIRQSLERLGVVGSVLMIAAHPDDENTALLAYFARGRHARTGYLSLTRGEGGQNFIGREQGEALGVIRTQELLAARRIDGAEQFFSRAIDFGFSKSAGEALAKWGREETLGDVVWTIRRFRPDVIVLRFSGTPRDGHGQHQASAWLGKEAFEAAADPKRFPEQLQWVKPWRAKRVLWNTFGWTREMQKMYESLPEKVTVDTGEYNPILGYSYEEIAGMSRSEHRSQAMGVPERKGPWKNYLTPVAGDKAGNDVFDGIDLTWNRIPGGKTAGDLIAQAIREFDPEHPERTVPVLLKARAAMAKLDDFHAKEKLAEAEEAIALCAGLWMDASAETASVTPGSTLRVELQAINRSPLPATLERVAITGAGTVQDANSAALPFNETVTRELSVPLPPEEPLTQPYWLREPRQGDRYAVPDQRLIGLADSPAPLEAEFTVRVDGTGIQYRRPVWRRYVDTARGERVRPLAIVPPVAIRMPETAVVFPSGAPKTVEIEVRATGKAEAGELKLTVPRGWSVDPAARPYDLGAAGEQAVLPFRITPPAEASHSTVSAAAGANDHGMQGIEYPHIPEQALFPAARAALVRADVRNLARRVGYVMGPGDEMPEALRELGCEVTLLDSAALAAGDLSQYDAIVTGVRSHSSRPDLPANRNRLLEYVKQGGTLVVQYNRPEAGFRPGDTIGPYPFTVGNLRVSVEEAPVEFAQPDSPLLQAPNRITAADFEGWVQERGLYFASEWDQHYQAPLSSHDPGERPLAGGTLYAPYGKGAYVFTAYSWFRQLPAGVPGAYRIFANLISAGKVLQQHAATTTTASH